ncbi:MAG TPA: hypothetical protein VFY29_19870 [Terriglobia bacterium]|nr:hypothetical protein [Terriglobia bacterium]
MRRLQSLEAWYQAESERHLDDLSKILQAEVQAEIAEIRKQYEQRVPGSIVPAPVSGQNPHAPQGLVDEITRSEADVARYTEELERLVADDSVELSRILQVRSKELEMKAYIRGLRFYTQGSGKEAD